MLTLNPFRHLLFMSAVAILQPDRRSVFQAYQAFLRLFPTATHRLVERILYSLAFRSRRVLRAVTWRTRRHYLNIVRVSSTTFRLVRRIRRDPRLIKRGLQALADGDRLILRRIVFVANREADADIAAADDRATPGATDGGQAGDETPFRPENGEIKDKLARAAAAYERGMKLASGDVSRSILEHFATRMGLVADSVHPLRTLNSFRPDKGLKAAAERNFRMAVELDPTFAEAWFALGTVSRARDEGEIALGCFAKATSHRPRLQIELHDFALKARANFACGQCLRDRGQYDAAIEFLRQAILIEPTFGTAHRILGDCLKRVGRYTEALRHFDQAMMYRPHIPTLPEIPETTDEYLEAMSTKQTS